MDDLLQEFLAETTDYLTQLDQDIVTLEQAPDTAGLIDKIFRIIHTIKGTCGFIGLSRLEAVSHATENVLGKFRDKTLPVTPDAVSVTLEGIDAIREIVDVLKETAAEPAGDDRALIARLNACADGQAADAAPESDETALWGDEEDPSIHVEASESGIQDQNENPDDDEVDTASRNAAAQPSVDTANSPTSPNPSSASQSIQTIRVNLDLLDDLMTIVSELVLTRNQLLQIARTEGESPFDMGLQKLNLNVSELQEGIMKTRMQPIGAAWEKFPRVVRDLSKELGKQVKLDMSGQETELDRQVLELIRDPLTHMVRNAIDHGIEDPKTRKKSGKPEAGTLALSAYHEGGHIIIDISDDGKGLDCKKIGAKAVSNGLLTEAELKARPESQILQLIFAPGLSTAEKVTAVSGRGVGMDVVRSNIEKIGGSVDVQSKPGKGSRFRVKIPLTLAIVSSLIVEASGHNYAIPQINITEIIRVGSTHAHKLEWVREQPVLRLRDKLVPLIDLCRLFKLDPENHTETRQDGYAVIMRIGYSTFGIVVDTVKDTEEIVVKRVSPLLSNISYFSGNTILGDGSVVMILDPNGIAREIGETRVDAEQAAKAEAARRREAERIRMLVFQTYDQVPKAVPVSMIGRIEKFPADKVEISENQQCIQYRGSLMPIYSFSGVPFDSSVYDHCNVLVFRDDKGHHTGLHVSKIIDIVEDVLDVKSSQGHEGILGSAIIQGQVTEVIDLSHFLRLRRGKTGHARTLRKVLCVDDSRAILERLEPILVEAGLMPYPAASGAEGLMIAHRNPDLALIISDIEMPEMNGFQFVKRIKENELTRGIPVIGLSSLDQNSIQEKLDEAGFDAYLQKFDKPTLLQVISSLLEDAVDIPESKEVA